MTNPRSDPWSAAKGEEGLYPLMASVARDLLAFSEPTHLDVWAKVRQQLGSKGDELSPSMVYRGLWASGFTVMDSIVRVRI